MFVAGVMSGTSADGVDVALCRIRDFRGTPHLTVQSHTHTAFPPPLREAVLRAMSSRPTRTMDLARLNWRLGLFYAGCVAKAQLSSRSRIDLVGCHGQTVYHQGRQEPFLGETFACSWQTGETSLIAERLRCPVISDFRVADMAAGGQGAPLVPMLDYTLLRSRRKGRVLQNLGGIANLTAIPANASLDELLAFDTGPANMVVDECMRRLFDREFDRGGRVARTGTPSERVLQALLQIPYFSVLPPKSCGREEFGDAFTTRFLRRCRAQKLRDADIIATATALTSRSILDAYGRFVTPLLRGAPVECVLSGGGTRNLTLLKQLRAGWEAAGAGLREIADFGVASEAKEASAFALLAWLTWQRRPGNVPRATGASHPVILGRIAFGPA